MAPKFINQEFNETKQLITPPASPSLDNIANMKDAIKVNNLDSYLKSSI